MQQSWRGLNSLSVTDFVVVFVCVLGSRFVGHLLRRCCPVRNSVRKLDGQFRWTDQQHVDGLLKVCRRLTDQVT